MTDIMHDNEILTNIVTSGLRTCLFMSQYHVCLTVSKRGVSPHDFVPCLLNFYLLFIIAVWKFCLLVCEFFLCVYVNVSLVFHSYILVVIFYPVVVYLYLYRRIYFVLKRNIH